MTSIVPVSLAKCANGQARVIVNPEFKSKKNLLRMPTFFKSTQYSQSKSMVSKFLLIENLSAQEYYELDINSSASNNLNKDKAQAGDWIKRCLFITILAVGAVTSFYFAYAKEKWIEPSIPSPPPFPNP